MKFLIAMMVVNVSLVCGCAATNSTERGATSSEPAQRSMQRVDAISTFATPTALNLDHNPDSDGVGVTIYFQRDGVPAGIPVRSGVIECFLYDNGIKSKTGEKREPFHLWTLNSTQFRPFEIDSHIGTGYRIALRWGNKQPVGDSVTLVVQYTDIGKRPLFASPVTITVVKQ